jgi:putative transposase
MCREAGCDADAVATLVPACGVTAPVRARGDAAQAIKHEAGVTARRWVVERAHSWMNRFRRLLVRWDKKPEHDLALLHFACGLIAFRAAGLFG